MVIQGPCTLIQKDVIILFLSSNLVRFISLTPYLRTNLLLIDDILFCNCSRLFSLAISGLIQCSYLSFFFLHYARNIQCLLIFLHPFYPSVSPIDCIFSMHKTLSNETDMKRGDDNFVKVLSCSAGLYLNPGLI